MIVGERIDERLKALGMSQSELARRVGLKQPTITRLIKGDQAGTAKLHLIARQLLTTPAYLTGETDDPDKGAPAPPPAPVFRQVMMPVSLPSSDALTAMFRAILMVSRDMQEDELARELAERLPTALAGALRAPASPPAHHRADQQAPSGDRDGDHLARPQASSR